MVSRIPVTFLNVALTIAGLLYNLFADAQLGLGLVPDSIYQMQSTFYPTVANEYGVPLDTRNSYTKGDWQCFAAAIASSDTRNTFFKLLANWVTETPTNRPLTDLYDTITGKYVPLDLPSYRHVLANRLSYPSHTFVARPVMGGAFAPLLVTQ